jgi:hypothetical protein
VLAANDTTSMKPRAATSPRLAARVRMSEEIGSSIGLALNVAFSAVCISPKTPEAVTRTVSTPRIVARAPVPASLARWRMDLMKSPHAGPRSWPSSRLIAARADSWPKTRPAIATTMRSTGASEVAA